MKKNIFSPICFIVLIIVGLVNGIILGNASLQLGSKNFETKWISTRISIVFIVLIFLILFLSNRFWKNKEINAYIDNAIESFAMGLILGWFSTYILLLI